MFIPNATCVIRRSANYDKYGQPIQGPRETIRCALVRYDLKTADSTVRADSGATRGNIKEIISTGRVLLDKTVNPNRGDLLILSFEGRSIVFKIKEVEPRINVLGVLDHWEVDIEKSEDKLGDQ